MGAQPREQNGKWYVFASKGGRRKAYCCGSGPAGKKAAEEAAVIIRARLATLGVAALVPTPAPSRVPTLAEYAGMWQREHVAAFRSPSTQAGYALAFRDYWLPKLGAIPLDALTHGQIKGVTAELKSRLKPGTIRSALIPLRACLNAAAEAGHLTKNPVGKLSKLVDAPTRIDPQELFTEAESDQIVSTAYQEMPARYVSVLALCRMGARIGEVLALQVGDLDFQASCVNVRRTLSGRRVRPIPKGKKPRRVEMSPQLRDALSRQASLVQAEAAVRGADLATAWLFSLPRAANRPQYPSWFSKYVWRPLLGRAGVRYRSPHKVRHTIASRLLASGVGLPDVAAFLGHQSPKVTADVYAHTLPDARPGIAARLDSPGAYNPGATVAPERSGQI